MASLQAAARSPLFSRTLPSAVSYFYQKTAGGSIRAFGYQRVSDTQVYELFDAQSATVLSDY